MFVLLIVDAPTVLSERTVDPVVCPAAITTVDGVKVPCVAEGVMVMLTPRMPPRV